MNIHADHAALLARTVCSFNARPEVHRSWLVEALPATSAYQGPEVWQCHAATTQTLLCDAQPCFDFDFRGRTKRLALLPADVLRRLTSMLGLWVHARALQQPSLQPLREALAKRVGAEDAAFVFSRLMQVRPPRVGIELDIGRTTRALASVWRAGYAVLGGLFARAGSAVRGRLRLKLPRRIAAAPVPPLQAGSAQRAKEALLMCILPERLPQWDWLF
jgi:type III secretion protein K